MAQLSKIYGTIIILFVFSNSFSQTIEEAAALFARKQLDSALIVAKSLIEQNKSNANAIVLAGRILVSKKKYAEAFEYLEKAQTITDAPLYSKAWALCEIAPCYYSKGDYLKAKESLTGCIELNATKNATAAANNSLLKLGLDKFYDEWITRESLHFIFHFQDTVSVGNVSNYILRKEAAFDSINNFFKAKLPKKIDYFVWSNSAQAKSLFKRELAFTDASLCITHTEPNHTVGHEMTHSISYHAVTNAIWNKLIAEGLCVYFDLSKRNNITALKTKIETSVSIVEIWKGDLKLGEEIIYPLGGELVKRLIEKFGREKFIQLLANQTYESARNIYGVELDNLISALEKEINR